MYPIVAAIGAAVLGAGFFGVRTLSNHPEIWYAVRSSVFLPAVDHSPVVY